MQNEEIKNLIEEGIPDCVVEINGDGRHFDAIIISDVFAGKTMVQQHQVVYGALGEKMGTDIHALSLTTYTPDEWQKKKHFKLV